MAVRAIKRYRFEICWIYMIDFFVTLSVIGLACSTSAATRSSSSIREGSAEIGSPASTGENGPAGPAGLGTRRAIFRIDRHGNDVSMTFEGTTRLLSGAARLDEAIAKLPPHVEAIVQMEDARFFMTRGPLARLGIPVTYTLARANITTRRDR